MPSRPKGLRFLVLPRPLSPLSGSVARPRLADSFPGRCLSPRGYGETVRLEASFDHSLKPAHILAEVGNLLPVGVELVFEATIVLAQFVEPSSRVLSRLRELPLHVCPEFGELSLSVILGLGELSLGIILGLGELSLGIILDFCEMPPYLGELSLGIFPSLGELASGVCLDLLKTPVHVADEPRGKSAENGKGAAYRCDDLSRGIHLSALSSAGGHNRGGLEHGAGEAPLPLRRVRGPPEVVLNPCEQ